MEEEEECSINHDNTYFDDPCASFDSAFVIAETQVLTQVTQVSMEPTQLSLAVIFDSQETHLENSLLEQSLSRVFLKGYRRHTAPLG
jgi:hypothetical protein